MYTSGEAMSSKPEMSWLQYEKPLRPSESFARSDSAMEGKVLVLLPPFAQWLNGASEPAGQGDLWQTLGLTLLKVLAFITLMLVVGRRVFPWLLWQVAGYWQDEPSMQAYFNSSLMDVYGVLLHQQVVDSLDFQTFSDVGGLNR